MGLLLLALISKNLHNNINPLSTEYQKSMFYSFIAQMFVWK
jgi:hypothetical protein